MDIYDKVLIGLAIFFACVLGIALGYEVGRKDVRKEALLKNHAYYAADSDGSAMFTWR